MSDFLAAVRSRLATAFSGLVAWASRLTPGAARYCSDHACIARSCASALASNALSSLVGSPVHSQRVTHAPITRCSTGSSMVFASKRSRQSWRASRVSEMPSETTTRPSARRTLPSMT